RPYLQLPKGHYRLSFDCSVGAARMSSQPVLGLEVVAWHRWRKGRSRSSNSLFGPPLPSGVQQTWRDFTVAQLQSGSRSVDFMVPPELSFEGGEEVLFAFRFLHMANSGLTVRSVELRQIPGEEASPAMPREWRLLARLAKGKIGTREADCVTV